MQKEDFEKCWFQLADMQTEGVSAAEYSGWIRSTVGAIRKDAMRIGGHVDGEDAAHTVGVKKRDGTENGVAWIWRQDQELFARLAELAGEDFALVKAREASWHAVFVRAQEDECTADQYMIER